MPVISFDNVYKKYRIGQFDTLKRLLTLGRSNGGTKQDFWALQDVSFNVEKGETIGIIGPNGAGKSTILKLLAGVTSPDQGSVHIEGRVAPLIEVGAGFHPELTGRENVYLNGAIMGLSSKEMGKKFNEIVDFAELWDFIDTPVKRYSSGMFVRLGFAVAVHTEPSILLIDEVLAVGDITFQNKCLNLMTQMLENKERTIVLVSHDMNAVRLLCDRCILLDKGCIVLDDTPNKVLNNTRNVFFKNKANVFNSDVINLYFVDDQGNMSAELNCKDSYTLMLELNDVLIEEGLIIAFSFVNLENKFSYRMETDMFKEMRGSLANKKIAVHFPEINLPNGSYTIRLAISDGNYVNRKYHFEDTIYFSVKDSIENPKFMRANWSVVT